MNVLSTIATPNNTIADELWYKDAIIYQLHVKAFADSNHDGIGDFAGLTEKLDYLHDLGVTALWLLPFYPSPGRDDGYDISDYGAINPDFGTMKDFRRFIAEAKRRGMRVITELVINHTSDQHDWFKRARRSPAGSSARNWYVWSDTDQKYQNTRIIFTDTEKSNWTWDPIAGAFYWHRFFSHQPDLNFDNPRVVRSVIQVMKRWLDAGVDGFRLDAIPYLCEREGTSNENLPETHAVIKQLRAALDSYMKGKVLLAEANQWPEDVQEYFGDSDECHMAYHFPLMPRIYMAIAQEDRFPITDILRQTPDIPDDCQWALFLRNHDELTLEMVTDVERDYLWSTYAHDPRARINVGIRRRLAPLMDNDRRKIELMNSLLLSLPGTPIIYYGDEIGMGDNIYLGDRNSVRTPMQWSPDRNGGFSKADPARLFLPSIMDPVYGYEAVNVEAQSRSLSSLLSATKKLISVRKSSTAFGRGTITFVRPNNRSVLAYVRQHEDKIILCIANLSRSAQATELDLSNWHGRIPMEMLGRTLFPAIGELPYMITLSPYGFYWFELQHKQDSATVSHAPFYEFETLVVPAGATWVTLARTRGIFERDVLPPFLSRARWFPERNPKAIQTKVTSALPFSTYGENRPWVALFEATLDNRTSRYVMPMQIHWKRFDRHSLEPNALAAVRQGSREGTLYEVAAEVNFIRRLLKNLHRSVVIDEQDARLEFIPTAQFAKTPLPVIDAVHAVETEQTNSTALVGTDFVVKTYRRLMEVTHPEVEMTRFLTEHTDFANTPALLGSVELVEDDKRSAICIVHKYVKNQGDAWTFTSGFLDRYVEEHLLTPDNAPIDDQNTQVPFALYLTQMGRRIAEMQMALASRDDIPEFQPQPLSYEERSRWIDKVVTSANSAFHNLQTYRKGLKLAERNLVDQALACQEGLDDKITKLFPENLEISISRHHGDLHLGQILIAKDDIYIIDFEGEPQRNTDQRRQRAPAARDLAGMLRSIDYAAAAALERALKISPADEDRLGQALTKWHDRAIATFLNAYRAQMTDHRLWPQNDDDAKRLLDFFLLEKVFYEIEYELAFRPVWMPVPLRGILKVLHPKTFEAPAGDADG